MSESPQRNICLKIAYLGGDYSGWQLQASDPTVQGEIEKALQQITGTLCRLRGAGRTDAGVHAQGQLANFKTDSKLTTERFRKGINALTPDDITIVEVRDVGMDFDSRRDNRGKHYRYTIFNERIMPPQFFPTCWHRFGELDLQLMAKAAQSLVGNHDFAAFQAADCERENTQRLLYRVSISNEGPLITIDVEGTAFLKNMVRIIAGTLADIGARKLGNNAIEELLQNGDRREAGITAPAKGLCMMRVFLK